MKKDFPIFTNNPEMIYLDSAATSQKPQVVIDQIKHFYEFFNANSHRGLYPIGIEATEGVENARKIIANFVNAKSDQIVFTKSTTESINNLARAIPLSNTDNIVITEIEHHSNFVPWQQRCKQTGAQFRVVRYDKQKEGLEPIFEYVDENTVVVAITGMSNVTGYTPDIPKIVSEIRSKNKNTIIVLDACQLAAHKPIDAKQLDVDYMAFSGHKVFGPFGVGVLYGKDLSVLENFLFGGNMINSVSIEETTFSKIPHRLEAGTLDAAGIIATGTAIEYVTKRGFDSIIKHENELTAYANKQLKEISQVKVLADHPGPIISFVLDNIPTQDIATYCASKNVCIRSGHHCAEPYLFSLECKSALRLSLSIYNTKKDIDTFIEVLKSAIELFSRNKK